MSRGTPTPARPATSSRMQRGPRRLDARARACHEHAVPPRARPKPSTHRRPGRGPSARLRAIEAEWVLGAIQVPPGLYVLVFLDRASNIAYSCVTSRLDEPAVAEAWRGALLEAAERGVPAPRRLRATSSELADLLRGVTELAVDREPADMPELVALGGDIQQLLQQTGLHADLGPSYFGDGRVGVDVVRSFFAAALAFRDARPWRRLAGGEVLDLEIPALGIDGAGAILVHDDDTGGLAILADPEDLADFSSGADELRNALALCFLPRRELPEGLRAELRRLDVPPRIGRLPVLVALGELGLPRPLTADDYRVATATIEAVRRFADDALADPALARSYGVDLPGEILEVRLRHPDA